MSTSYSPANTSSHHNCTRPATPFIPIADCNHRLQIPQKMTSHVYHNGVWVEIRHGTSLDAPQVSTHAVRTCDYPAGEYTRIPYYGPGYLLQHPNPTVRHVTRYVLTPPLIQASLVRQIWYATPSLRPAANIVHQTGPVTHAATQTMNYYQGQIQTALREVPQTRPQSVPSGYTGMSANNTPSTGGVYVMGSETYRHIIGHPRIARTVHQPTPGTDVSGDIPWFVSKEDYDVDRAVRNDWNTWAKRYHGSMVTHLL